MHLAIIRQRYNPFGGAERFIERAVESLRERGTRVTVITRSWQGASTVGEVEVCNPFYLGKIWRDWSFARDALSTAHARQYDFIQSHERIVGCDIYRAGDGVHAEWLAVRSRLQNPVERLLTRLSPYHNFVLARERRMFASPRLRAVICNSEMVRDEIQAHFSLPSEKLHVVYSGVDTNRFHPGLKTTIGPATRRQLGIPAGVPIALFVGSGFLRKGLSVAIQALARTSNGVHLLVVGADRHSERYARLASELGVAKRLHMMGGRENVLEYLGCADFFVLPTLYDPFPNAALEALACGLPVITSTKCGAAPIIARGHCGRIHDALDISEFARSMDALGSAIENNQMSVNARRAAEGLSLKTMAANMLELYGKLGFSPAPTRA